MVKSPPAKQETIRNAGDVGSIPGLGRSPGEENGSPLQYSCLENPVDSTLVVMGLRRAGHELATEQQQLNLYDSVEWKACVWFSSNHKTKQKTRKPA